MFTCCFFMAETLEEFPRQDVKDPQSSPAIAFNANRRSIHLFAQHSRKEFSRWRCGEKPRSTMHNPRPCQPCDDSSRLDITWTGIKRRTEFMFFISPLSRDQQNILRSDAEVCYPPYFWAFRSSILDSMPQECLPPFGADLNGTPTPSLSRFSRNKLTGLLTYGSRDSSAH